MVDPTGRATSQGEEGAGPAPFESTQLGFTTFYQVHRQQIWGYVKQVAPYLDAEAIRDATFEKAWKNWPRIHLMNPRAWVFKVARNLVNDTANEMRREQPKELFESAHPLFISPDSTPEERDELRETLIAVAALRPTWRDAVTMSAFGLDVDEIAMIMSCSRKSAIEYIAKGRADVRNRVGNTGRRQRKPKKGKRQRGELGVGEGHAG